MKREIIDLKNFSWFVKNPVRVSFFRKLKKGMLTECYFYFKIFEYEPYIKPHPLSLNTELDILWFNWI